MITERFTDHVRAWTDPYTEEMIEAKLWGAAVALSHNRHSQTSLAVLDVGGFSSRHYHKTKTNVFYVTVGELAVHFWEGPKGALGCDSRDPDRTVVLKPGDALGVIPGHIHQMEALKDTVAVETYHARPGQKVCLKDIHRYTKGGKR